MRDLTTKAIKNADDFEQLGIKVFDSEGNMRNMAQIVRSLENALAGMNAEQQKATLLQAGFADKSLAFLTTLLGTSDAIAQYEAQLKAAGGTTEEIANKQLTPMQQAMARFGAAWTELSLKMEPVYDALVGFVDLGTEIVQWASKQETAFKAMGITLNILRAMFYSLGVVVNLALQAVTQLVAQIVKGLEYMGLVGEGAGDKVQAMADAFGTAAEEHAKSVQSIGKDIAKIINGYEDASKAAKKAADEAPVAPVKLDPKKQPLPPWLAAIASAPKIFADAEKAAKQAAFDKLLGQATFGLLGTAPQQAKRRKAEQKQQEQQRTMAGPAAALRRGSAEARSAVLRAQAGAGKPMKNVEKNTKKTAEGVESLLAAIEQQFIVAKPI